MSHMVSWKHPPTLPIQKSTYIHIRALDLAHHPELCLSAPMARRHRVEQRLPKFLHSLFWDHTFSDITLPEHLDFVIGRELASGDINAIVWLRKTQGDEVIREWLVKHRGRGLDARRLRFWEIILNLPHNEVTKWIRDPSRQIWEARRTR